MLTKKQMSSMLVILVFLSLVVTACAPVAPAAPAAPAQEPAEEAAEAPTELSLWTWKIFHVPGLKAIAKNFEEKTGIKVAVTAYNPDEVYRTKITTAAQSGDLPDVLSYWSGGHWDMAATDLLLELTDKVDDEWQSDFLPGTFDRHSVFPQDKYDFCQNDPECAYKNIEVGQVFSVPYLAGQAWFVYGNKAIMEEAGLDPNTPPETAEEWLEMMKTIKEKTDVPGLVTGVQNPDVLHFWVYNPLLITSCGVETYDAIYNGEDSFANPCSMRVLEFLYEVAQNDLWMPGILQTNIDPADVAFSQGKVAFDVGGTYTLGFLLAQGMDADNLISFAIPPLEGSAYDQLEISSFPLIDATITNDSAHPEEALEFVRFLTSPEQMAIFAKATGDMPAVKVPADPETVGPAMVGLLNALSDWSPFNDSEAQMLDAPSKVLKIGLQQFITGETTPEELAVELDKANEAAWKDHGGS
ncbi:MAG: carbohydrate ABC transporter substrate-binding protein [Chloroflexi bacterium]|nr:carbohydrate ABC transporter substrate-binding protein [Chloroflexota bacterium]